ncbi:S-adenosyl-L-methionine-dependent methyltransferase, partial [Coniophora puteana RWD-64-598 SS2]
RLDSQYKIFKKSFGNALLHGPVSLSSGAEVLDCGCATGAWITDMSQEYPHVKLTGVDISSTLFPQSDLTLNTTFLCHSTIALPEEWTDRFAVVHQSILIAGLTVTEWPLAIAEMYRVCAPGGSIQLMEPIFGVRADKHFYRLDNAFMRARNMLVDDRFDTIERMLKDEGFVGVTKIRNDFVREEWSEEERKQARETLTFAKASFKDAVRRTPGVPDAEKFDELLEEWKRDEDAADIFGPDYEAWTFCARKP